ncbi:hypothetical protein [Streptomyces zaomyceticus]|uniref:hypothetical protein n=1 Tax=Streptomyces zaomyceticus TaxID=68286 RepID=UPI0036CFD6E6
METGQEGDDSVSSHFHPVSGNCDEEQGGEGAGHEGAATQVSRTPTADPRVGASAEQSECLLAEQFRYIVDASRQFSE